MKKNILVMFLIFCSACTVELGEEGPDIQETAQQVGDVIASIDETSGSTGTFAFEKLFNRYQDQWIPNFSFNAYAATCGFAGGFSTCVDGLITRTFDECTIGSATFDGTVALTFSEEDCSFGTQGSYVTRVPSFTVTGRRGATLHVEKSGSIGQRVTRTNSSLPREFSLSNDGIRRYFVKDGETIFDFTTTTTNLFFTGSGRNGRVITAGELVVIDNLNEETCTYEPTNVTYQAGCNCAVSGSWTGTCGVDEESSTITHTGCGTATFVKGADTQEITFDRCHSIN